MAGDDCYSAVSATHANNCILILIPVRQGSGTRWTSCPTGSARVEFATGAGERDVERRAGDRKEDPAGHRGAAD